MPFQNTNSYRDDDRKREQETAELLKSMHSRIDSMFNTVRGSDIPPTQGGLDILAKTPQPQEKLSRAAPKLISPPPEPVRDKLPDYNDYKNDSEGFTKHMALYLKQKKDNGNKSQAQRDVPVAAASVSVIKPKGKGVDIASFNRDFENEFKDELHGKKRPAMHDPLAGEPPHRETPKSSWFENLHHRAAPYAKAAYSGLGHAGRAIGKAAAKAPSVIGNFLESHGETINDILAGLTKGYHGHHNKYSKRHRKTSHYENSKALAQIMRKFFGKELPRSYREDDKPHRRKHHPRSRYDSWYSDKPYNSKYDGEYDY